MGDKVEWYEYSGGYRADLEGGWMLWTYKLQGFWYWNVNAPPHTMPTTNEEGSERLRLKHEQGRWGQLERGATLRDAKRACVESAQRNGLL